MDRRRFEELTAGESRIAGSVSVTEAEIIAFAEQYDPQPFHVDPAAAEEAFGGVIASGMHTAALCMRVVVEEFLDGVASGPALGLEELRWRAPVRPGDSLDVEVGIDETEPWDEEYGLIHLRTTATKPDGRTAMTSTALVLIERGE